MALKAKLPKGERRQAIALSLDQALALLAAVEGHRLYALYYLALVLGLRQGELCGLRWSDISWDKHTLTIRRTLRRVGKKTYEQTPKTRSGERILPLDADTILVLHAHWQNQIEEQGIKDDGWNPQRRVFCTEEGTPLSASNLRRHFKDVLKRAELPDEMRFHDLRHTSGSLMLDRGAQLVTVSKILGHSSPMITAGIYAHAFQDSQARAIEDLAQALRRRTS